MCVQNCFTGICRKEKTKMIAVEYGNQNKETVIFLHGGGLSWWNYRKEAELLQDKYRVVLPILDGHAGSDRRFTSIENNAEELVEYIDDNFGGSVLMMGGLSLGGQILAEALAKRDDICQYAVIESALAVPMKTVKTMIRPVLGMSYGLIKQKWFSRWQFRSLKIREDLYGDYYRDTCRISKEDMIAFLEANAGYRIKPSLSKAAAKTAILAGGRERKRMIESAKLLHDTVKNSSLIILAGYVHGELSLNHPEEYMNVVQRIFKID